MASDDERRSPTSTSDTRTKPLPPPSSPKCHRRSSRREVETAPRARSTLATLPLRSPGGHGLAAVVVDVAVAVDAVSSAARSLRAVRAGCTRCPRKRLACPDPRHSRCRVLARSVARSSVRARARRRVTLVKFQTGIWVKTSPPRNARRNADTRERRTETERTRNGERQREGGERGRERMIRRFLLLRCPGSGYGGGLALTAASLNVG